LVWLLRLGSATRVWFGYSGLVWLLKFGLATQAWFGYSSCVWLFSFVWLLRLGLPAQVWFGYSGLVGSDTDRLRMVLQLFLFHLNLYIVAFHVFFVCNFLFPVTILKLLYVLNFLLNQENRQQG
jgi:hypothetical protein